MSAYNATCTVVVLFSVLSVCIASGAAEKPWYAGTWDSRYNPLREHPKTVAIRMELLDRDTHIPVSGVRVFLEGEYFEQWISQDIAIAQKTPWWGDIFVDPNKREAQPKEFRLEAVSDPGGVVVFALQWQKEFPWDTKIGDKWTYSIGDQWLVYLDDIQKVQRLEIRHPEYKYIEAPLDFSHVADPVYYVKATQAGEDRYKLFEQNWRAEIRRKNVKMFVLDLGSELAKHQEQFCTWLPFFQRIRAKDYGTIYQIPENVPSLYGDSECGPYFVYDLGEILLEPIATRISVERAGGGVLTEDTSEGGTPWYSQYSRQAEVADTRVREGPGQGQSTTTQVATAPVDRQEADAALINKRRAAGGIVVQDLGVPKKKQIDLVMGHPMGIIGVEVVDVDSSSPAHDAGLRSGMIIASIKGERAIRGGSIPKPEYLVITPSDAEHFEKIFTNFADGDDITLSVWRRSEGNTIRPGYAGSEQKGKWYQGEISFKYHQMVSEGVPEASDSGSEPMKQKQVQPMAGETMKTSAQSPPSIREILSDAAKLQDAVQKAKAVKEQLAVIAIRSLPMPDPDTGQMTTFDAYARKLAADAGVGGSLGEDAVAMAYMLLFDSNFMTDEARIIQLPDGKYGTLNEAIITAADSNSGLDPQVLRRTVKTIGDLSQAYHGEDSKAVGVALNAFSEAVSALNSSVNVANPSLAKGLLDHHPTSQDWKQWKFLPEELPQWLKYKELSEEQLQEYRKDLAGDFALAPSQIDVAEYAYGGKLRSQEVYLFRIELASEGQMNDLLGKFGKAKDEMLGSHIILYRNSILFWIESRIYRFASISQIFELRNCIRQLSGRLELNESEFLGIDSLAKADETLFRRIENVSLDYSSDASILGIKVRNISDITDALRKEVLNALSHGDDGGSHESDLYEILGGIVVVVEVMRDSPADKIGLEKGDIIREIDGHSVYDTRYYCLHLSDLLIPKIDKKAAIEFIDINKSAAYKHAFISTKDIQAFRTGRNASEERNASGGIQPAPDISLQDSDIGHNPKEKTIGLGNGVRMDFVLIPAGEFYMGSPETEKDRQYNEAPVRQVRISRSFYMSKYEVTQDQYMAVMDTNPSYFKEGTRPVEEVKWDDAIVFCKKMSDKHAGSCRLPTEAEWEYACRAGTQTRFSFGDSDSRLGDYAWYYTNSSGETHPVGQNKPNTWGLFDMYGNVWEWCSDWYADSYRNAASVDPTGPASGKSRVLRGGGWYSKAWNLHSASRNSQSPDDRSSNNFGFRVVLELNPASDIIVPMPEGLATSEVFYDDLQDKESKALPLPQVIKHDLTGIVLVLIPPGTLKLGAPLSDGARESEGLRSSETQITKAYYLSQYEVTQSQYERIMKDNPSKYKGGDIPVHWVTWDDASEFCRRAGLRLPTEKEWEYACRAGTDTRYFFGDGESGNADLDSFAWFSSNAAGTPHEVGTKRGNRWGLFDTYGNVREWCQDVWPGRNPWIHVSPREFHVVKGGSWKDRWDKCCSASVMRGMPRSIVQPLDIGFRVAVDTENTKNGFTVIRGSSSSARWERKGDILLFAALGWPASGV